MAFARSAFAVGMAVVALVACTQSPADRPGGGAAPGSSAPVDRDCASGSFRVTGPRVQQAVLERWAADYRVRCGSGVTVAVADPGAGSALFGRGTVALVGSDTPLDDAARGEVSSRCGSGRVASLPLLLTPLTLAYRLAGVPQLTLTPAILARVYSGVITSWNDPEIAAANPGVELPSRPVRPVHRSTPAPATEAFTALLAARAAELWSTGAAAVWPAGQGRGAASADEVARTVAAIDGGLGYLEADVAERAGLAVAKLDSGAGPVAPDADSAGRAASAAAVQGDDQEVRLAFDYGGQEPDAYPLLLAWYLTSCAGGLPAGEATFVRTFLAHAAGAGQRTAAQLGHAPLPSRVLARVREAVESLPGG